MLDAMIRDGITLARSLELTVQWDGIIRIGSVHPLTLQDSDLARMGGLGEWRRVVEDLHFRLSDFIHRVVVHRRAESSYSSLQVASSRFGSPKSFSAV